MASVASQYWELTKPRVVALIVFTAVIGMFLATPELPGWRALVLGSLGIWLAAASAAAINHLLDQRIDAVMALADRATFLENGRCLGTVTAAGLADDPGLLRRRLGV